MTPLPPGPDRNLPRAKSRGFCVSRPGWPYRINLGAQRTLHLRFNDLDDPAPVPRDTSDASVIESNVPIVVQHTRRDSRHSNIGYHEG